MGRPESQLKVENAALYEFAAGLRQLRRSVGSPSYRALAGSAHFSASSLSRAAGGRSLPSLEVTLAFVGACGGDVDEWKSKWEETAATLTGVSDGAESSNVVTVPHGVRSEQPAPPRSDASDEALSPETRPGGPKSSRRLWKWVVSTGGIIVLGLTVTAAAIMWTGSVSPQRRSNLKVACPDRPNQNGAPQPVADCSDPGRAGCSDRVVTLGEMNVRLHSNQLAGKVELRYSPTCRSAWSRFSPAPDWNPGPDTKITVWAIRPKDGSSARFTGDFISMTVFTDMLLTKSGCMVAEVLIRQKEYVSPLFATPCLRESALSAPGQASSSALPSSSQPSSLRGQ